MSIILPQISENFSISTTINDELGLHNILIVANTINYIIFIGFIYIFYRNHRLIKVTDSLKELMKNILKTRKAVKYFVIYNVGANALFMLSMNIYYYFNKDELFKVISQNYEGLEAVSKESFSSVFFISQLVVGLLFIGFILVFYRIIYGILLKRLQRNYKELKKIEM